MPTIRTQRAQVLAEAVVSAYINELATRERPAPRPVRERAVARVSRPARERSRPRRVLVEA